MPQDEVARAVSEEPSQAPRQAVTAPAAEPAASGDWRIYRRLLSHVADQKRYFALAVLGFLLAAAGEGGFAAVFGLVVDAFHPAAAEAGGLAGALMGLAERWGRSPSDFLWLLPGLMLSLAILRAVGSVAGEYLLSRISFRAIHVIRCRLFERLLVMPSKWFDGTERGHVVSRLTYNSAQLRDTTTDALKILVQDGLKVIVFLGGMVFLNWRLTLFFLLISPVVALVVRFASRRFRRISERIQESMGDVTQVTSEAVSGYREMRVFGGEEYERRRFVAASETNRRQNLKMTATKAASTQLIQVIAALALAGLVALLFQPEVAGQMTTGELVTYLGLAGMLANPIKRLSDVNARLQRGLAAAQDIFAQLDQPQETDNGTFEVERVEGALRFEGISFAYREDLGNALTDISFDVASGQTVALVGPSGGGKSTLASLIARFHEPTAGRILLDGVPLADYRLASLRAQIALVSQNVTLFNDTLRNNIAYGCLAAASEADIRTAVRRAHAEDFVDALPQGWDTPVGDDGARLSGGERQRVAIARALLKDAPLLILDEATSSLDAHVERRIQAALGEVMEGRTTLVIAHRLSTVERADVIMVVEDGRIVESGRHAELLAAGGAYAGLYRSQFGGEMGAGKPGSRALAAPADSQAAGQLGRLVEAWYGDRGWVRWLAPLGALFRRHAMRRRRQFVSGRKPGWQAPAPVVVVGNITAGGTGKTPLVIWLAGWFRERGLSVGVVSRGYGGKASYPLLVEGDTLASQCGDEASLIARRAQCPVVVDPDRVRAVQALLEWQAVDVVIADDGLQHYALARQVEIAVLDGARGVGNGLCLPAGPLREPPSRLTECDWVVANGVASGLVADESVMVAVPTAFVHMASDERVAPAQWAAEVSKPVLAVAGIGNPDRFGETLRGLGLSPTMRAFPDHHRFKARDLATEEDMVVVVTEKDAGKLRQLNGVEGALPQDVWYLEIAMRFEDPVDDKLTGLLRRAGIDVSGPSAGSAKPAGHAQEKPALSHVR